MRILKKIIQAVIGTATAIYICGADDAMNKFGIMGFMVIGLVLFGACTLLFHERRA